MTTRFLTVAEAAPLLGLHADAVYDLCKHGLIAHYRMGPRQGRIFFAEADITSYLEGRRIAPVAPTPDGSSDGSRRPLRPSRAALVRRRDGGRLDGKPARHV